MYSIQVRGVLPLCGVMVNQEGVFKNTLGC